MKLCLTFAVVSIICVNCAMSSKPTWRSSPNTNPPYSISSSFMAPAIKCYFAVNGEFTFEEAKEACEARDASLAVLMSLSEDQFIRSVIDWEKVPGFRRNLTWIGQLWVGLERITPQPWMWIDGSPLKFSSWMAGEGNTSNDDHECIISRKFGWINSYHCDATYGETKYGVGALCQKIVFEAPPEAAEAGANFCGSKLLPGNINKFSMPGVSEKAYFIVEGSFSWPQARWECTSRRATLAIIRNAREDKFVHENFNIDSLGGNLWIGLRRSSKSYFEWIDGTAARYAGWFPDDVLQTMPDVAEPKCVVLKRWQKTANEIGGNNSGPGGSVAWAALECDMDRNTTQNWPDGPQFPIGALCEVVTWM